MSISHQPFGTLPGGQQVLKYTLETPQGFRAEIIPYGARITGIWAPDRHGRLEDVLWGYDTLEEYCTPRDSQGALIGRYAGVIRNAELPLGGTVHALVPNGGPHQSHGGNGTGAGFSEKLWTVERTDDGDEPALTLTLLSPDGEGGFPGNLHVRVTYRLEGLTLHIGYEARCDRLTALNLTSHGYFNLNGFNGSSIRTHELWVNARYYNAVVDGEIPTGENVPVAGTPLDFTTRKPIGRDLDLLPRGYDHNMVLEPSQHPCPLAATLYDPASGRYMQVCTDQPGLQLYTAGFVRDGKPAKRGSVLRPYHAICLETQHFPDSVHQPHFPTTLLEPGQVFTSATQYRFGAGPMPVP